MKTAVVLLSGGLDSATIAAIAKDEGYEVCALSFRYGQRHEVELEAARRVAKAVGASRHVTLDIDLREFGGSALTDDIAVPKFDELVDSDEIPITYVPARNTIFLSFALGWAEVLNSTDVFIGVNALDYSGYPDCRPEFLASFEAMANLATKAGVEGSARLTVHAPLMTMTKAEIITRGISLGVDYAATISCYDPSASGDACGACEACLLRKRGFRDANVVDPTQYR
ncbi:MAG: 7-cyano-7-deazaguanine synthase QueC [Gammaproteobacteria bacterium]|nr:7-cyano-7-deazaguanine synthase QueC [Gammaproteobacteria bacterium]